MPKPTQKTEEELRKEWNEWYWDRGGISNNEAFDWWLAKFTQSRQSTLEECVKIVKKLSPQYSPSDDDEVEIAVDATCEAIINRIKALMNK